MSNMESRVAEAISNVQRHMIGERPTQVALACATAAIRAMREPTEEMIEALKPPQFPTDFRDYIIRDWRIMIDAALAMPNGDRE